MTKRFRLTLWTALVIQCASGGIAWQPVWSQAQDETTALFDGKTLAGWRGDESLWRVEDGAITGETRAESPLRENSFLIWNGGELDDFELRLKFRIFSGNSGVQYRSRDLGQFRVGGYQADIDSGRQWMGILYDERGRGILGRRGEQVLIAADGQRTVAPLDDFDEEQFAAATQTGQWHEYVIRAEGTKLIHTINGTRTTEVDDKEEGKSYHRGVIAFQLHSGPPMKVQFKDIYLKRLK